MTPSYAESCKVCEANSLACGPAEVPLKYGACRCLWRADGADPTAQDLDCDKCVQECIGKYMSFDVGTFLKPAQARERIGMRGPPSRSQAAPSTRRHFVGRDVFLEDVVVSAALSIGL